MDYVHTVVLTGVTGKLGMSLLENFHKNHYKIICLVRDLDEFNNILWARLNIQESKLIEKFQLDLISQNWVSELDSFLTSISAVPDILVNNAAINTPIGSIEKTSLEEWKENFDINFFSPIALIKLFLEKRNTEKHAWIFNISGGGVTHKPIPFFNPYACAKSALIRLTENLSIEMEGQGISFNCITPGFLSSSMHLPSLDKDSNLPSEIREKISQEYLKGGQDPSKTFNLMSRIVSQASIHFSGNLISPIWDTFNDVDLSQNTVNNDDYKIRRRYR